MKTIHPRLSPEEEILKPLKPTDFNICFKTLTGGEGEPFPWQVVLYNRFMKGGLGIPDSCDIPTGLGKTSVVAIWLIALANSEAGKLPRRLVYVVNRRTVVDQTTDEVKKVRANLEKAGLKEKLERLCALKELAKESPLAISTLRGQFADNREWSADPCRPAIIAGTVDMIGSRLLFNGYGIGFRGKPLQGGFLGQEALIVHDEAHLEPAFQELLEAIAVEQKRCGDRSPIRVMELSATRRGTREPFTISPEDEKNATVAKRLNARKKLKLHPLGKEKPPDQLAKLALRHRDSGLAVIVFAQTVETVRKTAKILTEAKNKVPPEHVRILTGTLRGFEREELAQHAVFRRFKPGINADTERVAKGTVYLICTSAGEVGVNISADHMVTDLVTFESMAQRLGRLNRFGERNDSEVDVVYPESFDEKDPVDAAKQKTLALLEKLGDDASPNALRTKLGAEERANAFRPKPTILPVTDILFDAWALTTITDRLPGRPAIEPYLHGVAEWEPPETRVAWREEVDIIKDSLLELHPPAELLDEYPVKPWEMLRDKSARVFEELIKMGERFPQTPTWIVNSSGDIRICRLEEIIRGDDRLIQRSLILLPPSIGGLTKAGLLDGGESETPKDVSESPRQSDPDPLRRRIWNEIQKNRKLRLVREIDLRKDEDESGDPDASATSASSPQIWRWYEKFSGGDSDASKSAKDAVLLDAHTRQVTKYAEEIARKLALTDAELKAVKLAAEFHDLGKGRPCWQRSIGNRDMEKIFAKSGPDMTPIYLGDKYRHEFGSLIDLRKSNEFKALDEASQDLALHLIAAHHGRGRPHFPKEEIFDPNCSLEEAHETAGETPRRFARLQRLYGRWGLAHLESILRAADYAASANPEKESRKANS